MADTPYFVDQPVKYTPERADNPLGLAWHQVSPLKLPKPNPTVIYTDLSQPRSSVLNRLNLRRLFLKVWDSRQPLPDSKISRRSRRRWRGKGGVWQFDPYLLNLFHDAVRTIQESQAG